MQLPGLKGSVEDVVWSPDSRFLALIVHDPDPITDPSLIPLTSDNPRTFRAVKLRLTTPKATALVFSSGKVVCTGGASEVAAMTALHVYLSIVRTVHPEAKMCSLTIQNIVASCKFSAPVRLEELARAFMLRSAFDPELFPGLRLKLRSPKAKILVFCGGKCVIAGCRNRADLARAWAAVKIMVSPYVWTTADGGVAPTHTAMTAKRVASRKDKN